MGIRAGLNLAERLRLGTVAVKQNASLALCCKHARVTPSESSRGIWVEPSRKASHHVHDSSCPACRGFRGWSRSVPPILADFGPQDSCLRFAQVVTGLDARLCPSEKVARLLAGGTPCSPQREQVTHREAPTALGARNVPDCLGMNYQDDVQPARQAARALAGAFAEGRRDVALWPHASPLRCPSHPHAVVRSRNSPRSRRHSSIRLRSSLREDSWPGTTERLGP